MSMPWSSSFDSSCSSSGFIARPPLPANTECRRNTGQLYAGRNGGSNPIIRRVRLSDFDYALPPELIAQHPAHERTASRLLHLDGRSGAMADRAFTDIVELLAPNDLLVVN